MIEKVIYRVVIKRTFTLDQRDRSKYVHLNSTLLISAPKRIAEQVHYLPLRQMNKCSHIPGKQVERRTKIVRDKHTQNVAIETELSS
jgi:hypothetical protein